MSHSAAEIIAELLISQGVFSDPGDSDPQWGLYIGYMPDGEDLQDNIAAIYDTEGVKDGRLMDGPVIVHPGLTILLRANSYRQGWEKMTEVRDLLQAVEGVNVTVDATQYGVKNVSQQSPIVALGKETAGNTRGSKKRDVFSLNYLCTISEELVVPGINVPVEAMVIDHAVDEPVSGAQMEGHFHTNRGAGSSTVRVTLAKGTTNKHAHFVQKDAGEFIIDPHASDHFEWSGGPLADGQAFRLLSPVSNIYIFYSGNNTWTVQTAQGTVIEEL